YPEWQLKVCLIIHDEVVCEVNEQYANEAAKAIKLCLETAVKLCIPLIADVGIGDNYSDAKP
ncbi:MAG: DNA polymerase, partial [Methylococcales bacterium]|nr:DNA polymerase [Methylococcales bacterium]